MLAHAVFKKIAVFALFGIQNGKVGLRYDMQSWE
jgi:hypothetical protein